MEIRFCEKHDEYYLSPVIGDGLEHHKGCPKTYALQWREVIYYLNKLKRIKYLTTLRELSTKTVEEVIQPAKD